MNPHVTYTSYRDISVEIFKYNNQVV